MEFSEKLQLVVDYTKSLLDKVEKGEEISVEEQAKLDAHCELFKAKSDEEPEEAEEKEEECKEKEEEKEEAKKSASVYWEDDLASVEIDRNNLW